MSRVTVLTLVLSAVLGLRLTLDGVLLLTAVPRTLRIPFSSFPPEILGPEWKGEDVPLLREEEQKTGVAAYLQRHYTKGDVEFWVYAGFVSERAYENIHDPRYCFPGSGYLLLKEELVPIPVPGAREDSSFSETQWKDSTGEPVYSLHTLYYNNRLVPTEWRLRASRVFGIPYFTVITVSGDFVGSIEETRGLYREIVQKAFPLLLRHLP